MWKNKHSEIRKETSKPGVHKDSRLDKRKFPSNSGHFLQNVIEYYKFISLIFIMFLELLSILNYFRANTRNLQ